MAENEKWFVHEGGCWHIYLICILPIQCNCGTLFIVPSDRVFDRLVADSCEVGRCFRVRAFWSLFWLWPLLWSNLWRKCQGSSFCLICDCRISHTRSGFVLKFLLLFSFLILVRALSCKYRHNLQGFDIYRVHLFL